MDETKHHGAEPSPRYETRDATISGLVKFAIALFLLLVVALWAMRGLFHYFGVKQTLGPPASPFAETRPLPPGPRLQVAPTKDWQQLHASEKEMLDGYGWVDKQAGMVRIPISRAMDLLAQRGLPARASTPPKESSK